MLQSLIPACANALVAALLAPACAVCRRAPRRAAVRMCVRKLLAIDSADYPADLRQVRRPTRADDPNPQSLIRQSLCAHAALVEQRGRSRTCDRRVRRRAARDHSRPEIFAPAVAGAAACRTNAPARKRVARGRRLRRAGPAPLAPRVSARLQSGTRDRAPPWSAGRRGPRSGVARRERRSSWPPIGAGRMSQARSASVGGWFRESERSGQELLLVDDVSTTGATLEACARVLKESGASEVCALTAARVVTRRRPEHAQSLIPNP